MTLSVKDATGASVGLATGSGDGSATPYKSPVAVATGSVSDAAATDSVSNWSAVSLLKGLFASLAGLLKVGATYNSVQPTVADGNAAALQADVNGNLKVALATRLDTANDAVQSLPVSGKLSDGAGNALTVKTACGTASSSGVNAVLAAVTSKRLRVLSYSLQAANANSAAVTAAFQDDSGTPVVLSQSWDLNVREGVSKPFAGSGFYFQTTSGQALKLSLSAAQSVYWEVAYVEA